MSKLSSGKRVTSAAGTRGMSLPAYRSNIVANPYMTWMSKNGEGRGERGEGRGERRGDDGSERVRKREIERDGGRSCHTLPCLMRSDCLILYQLTAMNGSKPFSLAYVSNCFLQFSFDSQCSAD